MYFQRKVQKILARHIDSKEILVLTGMRQVGKTTLYRAIFDGLETANKAFLDIENQIEQKVFEEVDYNNIIPNLREYGISTDSRAYVFLDEIQAMPEVVRAVKYLYDHYDIKFFLTGSSSFYLKNLFPESLAGRKFVFELFPLDFEEFLAFKGVPRDFNPSFAHKAAHKNKIAYEHHKKYYDEYLEYGGFPGVVLSGTQEDKELKLKEILKSYFEKDVRSLADFRDLHAFRELMLLLMQRVGSKLEISKLASEVGVSRETVYSFLSFLEQTYFVHFITPFTKNVDREVSGGRKVYLCDTGILNQFAKVSEGSLFENGVFLNVRQRESVHFYQKRSGAEIDFVLDERIGCEVKCTGTEQDYRALKRAADGIGLSEAYLVTKQYHDAPYAIPAVEV